MFLHVIISSSNFKASAATHRSIAVSDALGGHQASDHRHLESEVFNTQAHPSGSGVVVQVTLDKRIDAEDLECGYIAKQCYVVGEGSKNLLSGHLLVCSLLNSESVFSNQ